MKSKVTYEEAVSELEHIVAQLENGGELLENSLKLFDKGTKLASYCYGILNSAEQKITELSKIEAETMHKD